jgi:hypothetical protein
MVFVTQLIAQFLNNSLQPMKGFNEKILPVILATLEAEIKRIADPGQPRQKARPYVKNI